MTLTMSTLDSEDLYQKAMSTIKQDGHLCESHGYHELENKNPPSQTPLPPCSLKKTKDPGTRSVMPSQTPLQYTIGKDEQILWCSTSQWAWRYTGHHSILTEHPGDMLEIYAQESMEINEFHLCVITKVSSKHIPYRDSRGWPPAEPIHAKCVTRRWWIRLCVVTFNTGERRHGDRRGHVYGERDHKRDGSAALVQNSKVSESILCPGLLLTKTKVHVW